MNDTYPEQITLPGQSSVADGPHDQSGMYVMHHAFRRDLAAFEAAVRATPIGDAATWRALGDRWTDFATVLHHHHGVEDEHLWPVLLAATTEDATGTALLHAMQAEHERIDPSLTAVAAGFATMVEHPCADHRNALDVHVTATRAALLAHLAHEETEALPLLQRTLSVEQNAAFEKAAQRAYPLRMIPFLLPWASDGLPDDVRRRIVESAGPAYGLLLRLLRGRYERAERRAFRYV
ncbi:hemerythrin domain-containing protein [Nocardioides islandensis]|uniref:Hemerythrin domain-containing protein n=1 Tax=Nocardioides islandensis TaxID=433663 RepID=A0A930YCK8_9ACTN|nr:hemerythrin domain-containing protein [Nocardioides islandensis]MBF4761803.1 hemerythrin domain-containing protein [Nocardioides islandensis]